jgi:hypothetical protein
MLFATGFLCEVSALMLYPVDVYAGGVREAEEGVVRVDGLVPAHHMAIEKKYGSIYIIRLTGHSPHPMVLA